VQAQAPLAQICPAPAHEPVWQTPLQPSFPPQALPAQLGVHAQVEPLQVALGPSAFWHEAVVQAHTPLAQACPTPAHEPVLHTPLQPSFAPQALPVQLGVHAQTEPVQVALGPSAL
jgi:hypothetical protein